MEAVVLFCLQPAKVTAWFGDLLEGLVFLESHRVVHLDLKLSNLLMDENGRVVISDFGKAVLLEDSSMQLPYQQGTLLTIYHYGSVH